MEQGNFSGASIYKHKQESVQRPHVGVEAQFSNKKARKTYRYDSSLAPELSWDESEDRPYAEWLLAVVADAAEKGEPHRIPAIIPPVLAPSKGGSSPWSLRCAWLLCRCALLTALRACGLRKADRDEAMIGCQSNKGISLFGKENPPPSRPRCHVR